MRRAPESALPMWLLWLCTLVFTANAAMWAFWPPRDEAWLRTVFVLGFLLCAGGGALSLVRARRARRADDARQAAGADRPVPVDR